MPCSNAALPLILALLLLSLPPRPQIRVPAAPASAPAPNGNLQVCHLPAPPDGTALPPRLDSSRTPAPPPAPQLAVQSLAPPGYTCGWFRTESAEALPTHGAETQWPAHRSASQGLVRAPPDAPESCSPIPQGHCDHAVSPPVGIPSLMPLPAAHRILQDKPR